MRLGRTECKLISRDLAKTNMFTASITPISLLLSPLPGTSAKGGKENVLGLANRLLLHVEGWCSKHSLEWRYPRRYYEIVHGGQFQAKKMCRGQIRPYTGLSS